MKVCAVKTLINHKSSVVTMLISDIIDIIFVE